MSMAARVRRPFPLHLLASALSLGIAGVQLTMALNLFIHTKRIVGGMLGFGALFGIVALGVAAIVIVFGLPALYALGAQQRRLLPRLLTVSAIQAFMFPLLRLLHFLVVFFLRPEPWDYLLGGAGLAVGALCVIFAVRSHAAASERRRRMTEPPEPS